MVIDVGELIDDMVSNAKYSREQLADKLEITSRTLRRYQNDERTMPVDLFLKLVLITEYYQILPIIEQRLDDYWHKKKVRQS